MHGLGRHGDALDGQRRDCSARRCCRRSADAAEMAKGSFSFVQISDSHIGFSKEGINTDVAATLKQAIARINALPQQPDFILHTGDLTHLSAAEEFDTLDQLLKSAKTQEIFFVPGEHDVTGDNGKLYRERFGKNSKGSGWYSFDHRGVHFIGLVNVVDIQQNGLGALGAEQLEWLEDDLKGRSSETPIVVFAHIPLWEVYPQWGWGTNDGAQASGLSQALRFGHCTERPHSSDDEEGRRWRDVSHRHVHGLSATRARQSTQARTDEG